MFKQKIGKVSQVEFLKNDGKFSGRCFITFESAKSASEAIRKMDQFDFKGRPMNVKAPIERDQSGNVVVEKSNVNG